MKEALFLLTLCIILLVTAIVDLTFTVVGGRNQLNIAKGKVEALELENKTQQLQIHQLEHSCFVALLGG